MSNTTKLPGWQHDSPIHKLSRMASHLLSIPSMSAETEKSFSSAAGIVSSLRACLDRHTIGITQSMRSWNRKGIVLPSWQ